MHIYCGRLNAQAESLILGYFGHAEASSIVFLGHLLALKHLSKVYRKINAIQRHIHVQKCRLVYSEISAMSVNVVKLQMDIFV